MAWLAAGILFGGTIVGLTYWMSPKTTATTVLLSQGVNELLFPVGCSLVLFVATALGKRVEA